MFEIKLYVQEFDEAPRLDEAVESSQGDYYQLCCHGEFR